VSRSIPGWSVPLALAFFAGLAVFFWSDPIGYGAPLDDVPALEEPHYDPATARRARKTLTFDGMECTNCHDTSEPYTGNPKKKGEFHERITLEHGRNEHCFNCHNRKDLGTFYDHGGEPIPLKRIQMLCAKCHGPTFRDWEEGAHGRRSGYWDKAKGRGVETACIACHDPHSPAFKAMEAAPPPHVNPRTPPGAGAGTPHSREARDG